MIQTVTGPIEAADLGVTLPHEHLFINLMREYRGDGLLNDPDLVEHELRLYSDLGGRSIVDVTSSGLDRNPLALLDASRRTGLNVVMGCGYYRDPYLPNEDVDTTTVEGLSERIVNDLDVGVDGTGIRAGVIGEVGSDKWFVSAREERSLRAAGRAQLRTGAALTTHSGRWPVGMPQLDILVEEGVDLRRVIVGHSDSVPDTEYHLALARRGAYVQFDMLGIYTSDYDQEKRIRYIKNLVEFGFGDHVLLSHDVCLRGMLTVNGGVGYGHILRDFVPRMRAADISDDLIERMMVTNPARALEPQ
ncbi:phosphotriesterase family protein [Brevibacterium sp. UCMA 11754]|uniref:phosphotriesterase family protein n=1 Tax=Brevibacterium sp. UCMA 11754 TaxID=2749198 RepID=UPI001F3D6007|nr:hypothetical protein [Brevibacterium sp. UCMA 11754]MCF2574265.1 phosphotriesterase-related protein [Brevibacterium sp. UCMA 11754]